MSTYIIKDEELYHFGIPGMRWGVRRFQPYPTGYGGSGRFIGQMRANRALGISGSQRAKAIVKRTFKSDIPNAYKQGQQAYKRAKIETQYKYDVFKGVNKRKQQEFTHEATRVIHDAFPKSYAKFQNTPSYNKNVTMGSAYTQALIKAAKVRASSYNYGTASPYYNGYMIKGHRIRYY